MPLLEDPDLDADTQVPAGWLVAQSVLGAGVMMAGVMAAGAIMPGADRGPLGRAVAGASVVATDPTRVITSGRLRGRTPGGGFSGFLAEVQGEASAP